MTGLDIGALRASLGAAAVPTDAAPMARYMKDRFEFLGVKAPARRAASKAILTASVDAPVDRVVTFAHSCWAAPEREFQYVACDVLARNRTRLEVRHADDLETLIVTKSWWDTVDALASPTVGDLVRAAPSLVALMDHWVEQDDLWLRRSAIIHQLRFADATDSARLFGYCLRRAGDTDFFIRKAIGWALRQYARTDPEAVRAFVGEHAVALSGLSRREALKRL